MPESFCSLSYLILAGFLLLLLLLLVNKALIRFRVNAEGELNANEHTENGFFKKAVIKFLTHFYMGRISHGYFGAPHASSMCIVHPIFLLLLDLTFSALP